MTHFKLFVSLIYFWQLFHVSLESNRIVNGERAMPGQFPAVVSIQNRRGNHYCGGTLINPDTILTAAHCFDSLDLNYREHSQIRILGDDLYVTSKPSDSRQIRFVRDVISHPEYDKDELLNDIAIIKVFDKFREGKNFRSLKLAEKSFPPNHNCSVSGWGAISDDTVNKVMSKALLYVKILILRSQFCRSMEYFRFDPDKQICAGLIEGGKDACYGDSGGGLYCDGLLAGVVSYGIGCAVPYLPGVYTDVSAYDDWIQNVTKWDGTSQISHHLIHYKK